jgi:protein TonB
MFNNLIESSSHTKEYKRRGSFLLFTGATYVVLFVITGVVSIYAYDARLEQQILEDITILSPQDLVPEAAPAPAAQPDRPRETNSNASTVPERAVAMVSVNRPEVVPEEVSATPSKNQPLPDHGAVRITGRDYNPEAIGGPGRGPTGGGTRVVQPPQVIIPDEPPPPPPPPTVPKVLKVSRVLNSEALYLPVANYPLMARQIRVQGTVIVQVMIDEDGRVVSAKANSGHPLLVPEAVKAAMRARFSPTMIGDQKVKVSGVITYNFVLGY